MKRPPMLMHVKIRGQEKGFGFWLPLFLLLPLALVVFIILSPLILIAVLILWPSDWGKRAVLVLKTTFEVFSSLHGLRVDFQSNNKCLYISVV